MWIDSGKLRAIDFGGNTQLSLTRDGWMLFNKHDMYVGRSLALYGEYCMAERDVLDQLIDENSTVIEVGANIGAHTVWMAKKSRLVYAFEPQTQCFQVLCANLAMAECWNTRAFPMAVGASNSSAYVQLLDPSRENNFGAAELSLKLPDLGYEVTEVIALDDGHPLVTVPTLIKIDVEGMENEVISGAAKIIRNHRPYLYVENDREDRSAELIARIRSFDYKLFWHLPLLFSANNFAGNSEDVFPNIVSKNMLCVPAETEFETNLVEVISHQDFVPEQLH